jgi:hypothetical protein
MLKRKSGSGPPERRKAHCIPTAEGIYLITANLDTGTSHLKPDDATHVPNQRYRIRFTSPQICCRRRLAGPPADRPACGLIKILPLPAKSISKTDSALTGGWMLWTRYRTDFARPRPLRDRLFLSFGSRPSL